MFLFPLFYVIREFHRFLHRGKAEFSVAIKFYDSKTFLSLVECFVNESHSRFCNFYFFTYKGTV